MSFLYLSPPWPTFYKRMWAFLFFALIGLIRRLQTDAASTTNFIYIQTLADGCDEPAKEFKKIKIK